MKDYIQVNKVVYDTLAKEYAFRRDNVGQYSESTEYLGYSLLKHVSEHDHLNVLEIGPGAGQILRYFEYSGCRTIGVELSQEMCYLCHVVFFLSKRKEDKFPLNGLILKTIVSVLRGLINVHYNLPR